MRLKRKVRVTRSICRACLFTIPVLPKLTVDTALPWTVQYQRHLETTLADAQCPLYHVGDLTQALAHCRTVIAPSYWRLHRVTPKTVLGEVRRRCYGDGLESKAEPLHYFTATTAEPHHRCAPGIEILLGSAATKGTQSMTAPLTQYLRASRSMDSSSPSPPHRVWGFARWKLCTTRRSSRSSDSTYTAVYPLPVAALTRPPTIPLGKRVRCRSVTCGCRRCRRRGSSLRKLIETEESVSRR